MAVRPVHGVEGSCQLGRAEALLRFPVDPEKEVLFFLWPEEIGVGVQMFEKLSHLAAN